MLAIKRLKEWQGKKGYNLTELAEVMDCSIAYLSQLYNDKQRLPSMQFAIKVEEATNRYVKLNDWNKEG